MGKKIKKHFFDLFKLGRHVITGEYTDYLWSDGHSEICQITKIEDLNKSKLGCIYRSGAKQIYLSNNKDIIVGLDEPLRIYMMHQVEETEESNDNKGSKNGTNLVSQRNKFIKIVGKELKIGDVIAVSWKADGDEIIGLSKYVGGPLYKNGGAQEARFKNFKGTLILDNTKFYDVFYRFGPNIMDVGNIDNVDKNAPDGSCEQGKDGEEEYGDREIMAALVEDWNNLDYTNDGIDFGEYSGEIGFHTRLHERSCPQVVQNPKPVKIDVVSYDA